MESLNILYQVMLKLNIGNKYYGNYIKSLSNLRGFS